MKQQNYNQLKYNQPKQSIIQFGEMSYEQIVRWLFSLGTIAMIINRVSRWMNALNTFYSMDGMDIAFGNKNLIIFDLFYLIALIAIWFIVCQIIYFVLEAIDIGRKKNQEQLRRSYAKEYDLD